MRKRNDRNEQPPIDSPESLGAILSEVATRHANETNDQTPCPDCGRVHARKYVAATMSLKDFLSTPHPQSQLQTFEDFVRDFVREMTDGDIDDTLEEWKSMFVASWQAAANISPTLGMAAIHVSLSLALKALGRDEEYEVGTRDCIIWFLVGATRNAANSEDAWAQALQTLV